MPRPVRTSVAAKAKDTLVKKEEDEFRREDCDEKDFRDEGPKKRRAKKDKEVEQAAKIISTEFLPSSMKKLRACNHCKLVLNRQRWIDLGKCPNCPSSGGLSETTEDFQNVIGQIYPKMSWVA